MALPCAGGDTAPLRLALDPASPELGVGRTGVFVAMLAIRDHLLVPLRPLEVVAQENYPVEVSQPLSSPARWLSVGPACSPSCPLPWPPGRRSLSWTLCARSERHAQSTWCRRKTSTSCSIEATSRPWRICLRVGTRPRVAPRWATAPNVPPVLYSAEMRTPKGRPRRPSRGAQEERWVFPGRWAVLWQERADLSTSSQVVPAPAAVR